MCLYCVERSQRELELGEIGEAMPSCVLMAEEIIQEVV